MLTVHTFLDLDGVLADFDLAVYQRFGKWLAHCNKKEKDSILQKIFREIPKEFFATLPASPYAAELIREVSMHSSSVTILSSTGTSNSDVIEQAKHT